MQELSNKATGPLLDTPPTIQEMSSVTLWATLTPGGVGESGWSCCDLRDGGLETLLLFAFRRLSSVVLLDSPCRTIPSKCCPFTMQLRVLYCLPALGSGGHRLLPLTL